mgnify:CR=1 FL=1
MPPEGTEIVEDKELDIDLDDADASSEAEKSADATSSSAADAKEPEGSDTASVVRYANIRLSAVLDFHNNRCGAGVNRIFCQFFYNR